VLEEGVRLGRFVFGRGIALRGGFSGAVRVHERVP
jgi:hypothetical protein